MPYFYNPKRDSKDTHRPEIFCQFFELENLEIVTGFRSLISRDFWRKVNDFL